MHTQRQRCDSKTTAAHKRWINPFVHLFIHPENKRCVCLYECARDRFVELDTYDFFLRKLNSNVFLGISRQSYLAFPTPSDLAARLVA